MSAQVESSFSLFDSASHVLDQADLISELVSGATLRNSPPSRMVTSSPILTTTSQSLTRPSSPSLESAFNILGDQVIYWVFPTLHYRPTIYTTTYIPSIFKIYI